MSDLIRREDAIDEIREVYEELFPTASGAFDEFVVTIIPNILRNLPSAEPERKWIPVTEALPKNLEHDWVLGQIRETDSGYLWIPKVVEYRESSDDWFEESIGWLKKNPDHAFEVIAWMPLPKPWRGE